MTLAQDPANPHRIGDVPIFDPLGMATQAKITQDSLPASNTTGVSFGYVFHDRMPERVPWDGIRFTPRMLAERAVNLFWGGLPLGLAVLLFDRFDPARRGRRDGRGGTARRRASAAVVSAIGAPALAAVPAPERTLATLSPIQPRPSAGQRFWPRSACSGSRPTSPNGSWSPPRWRRR